MRREQSLYATLLDGTHSVLREDRIALEQYVLDGKPPKKKRRVNHSGRNYSVERLQLLIDKAMQILPRTRLLEGEVPFAILAQIMDWSVSATITMAKRYGHIGDSSSAGDERARFSRSAGNYDREVPRVGLSPGLEMRKLLIRFWLLR